MISDAQQQQDANLETHCCICRDLLIIPVRPICFSCSHLDHWSQKSCYTYLRICMKCADHYFQLHLPLPQRKQYIRCLICTETMNPTKMHRNNIYEIDFLFMRCMPTRDVDCPFCNAWHGDLNNDLYRHIINDCTHFSWECVCGCVYTNPTRQQHLESCSKHSTCRECRKRILTTSMTRHMLNEHKYSLCCSCRMYVLLDHMSDHILHRCDERLVCCDVCMGLIRNRLFRFHIRNHYTEITAKIRSLTMNLEIEKERLVSVLEIMNENTITTPTPAANTVVPPSSPPQQTEEEDPYTHPTLLSADNPSDSWVIVFSSSDPSEEDDNNNNNNTPSSLS